MHFAVADAVGNQEPLAIRVPGEPGGELDPLMAEVERPADAAQHLFPVEPDKAVRILASAVPDQDLVDQRQKAAAGSSPEAAVCGDRLRAPRKCSAAIAGIVSVTVRAASSTTRGGSHR